MTKETYDKAYEIAVAIDVVQEKVWELKQYLNSNKAVRDLKDLNDYDLAVMQSHAKLGVNVTRVFNILEMAEEFLKNSGINIEKQND
jgi:predicted outer membrane protein